MFSFLTSKPLLLALIVSLSINGLLFGVSKYLYDAKVEAVGEVGVLKQTLSDQLESNNKAETACVIGHTLASELQEEKKALEIVEKESLDIVSRLPSVAPKKPVSAQPNKEVSKDAQEDVAELDSKLPDSLISVLQSHFDNVQRQGTHNPR